MVAQNQLDFSALIKATASLEKAVIRSQGDKTDEELRDAVIQRFEYTYELSWKMLKRQIEFEAANPAQVDAMSFRQLIRDAAERGLLDNPEKWFAYREQRNITSHTCDEEKAKSVYLAAIEFLTDAKQLLTNLQQRAA